ncbi:hypothetical protein LUZ60_016491 [Juncus effusus]|nr:hypothetical protein LUZ60_016491 [Juncus effusus]
MVAAIVEDCDKIIICREGEKLWTLAEDEYFEFPACPKPKHGQLDDMMFFEGNLYAINIFSMVTVVECGAPYFRAHYVRKPRSGKFKDWSILKRYLVVCSGNLLIVKKYAEELDENIQKICFFELFKFEKDTETWSRIYEIGDKALFLGQNGSISVSAAEIVGCRPNCIYFADDYYDGQRSEIGPVGYQTDNGVFCLDDNSVQIFHISHSVPFWEIPAMWLQQKI